MNPNRLLPTTLMCLLLLAGCAATAPPAAQHAAAAPDNAAQGIAMLERVSWGVNGGSVRQLQKEGWGAYLQAQLHPGKTSLPPAVQATQTEIKKSPRARRVQEPSLKGQAWVSSP